MKQLLINQRVKTSCLFLVLLLFFASCSKEDYLTDGERIGKELQTIINDNDIEWVEKRDIEHYYAGKEYSNFNISNGFISFGNEHYNLNHLIYYYTEKKDPYDLVNKPLKLIIIFEY